MKSNYLKIILTLIVINGFLPIVKGQPTWVISGAPIGDTSTYFYPGGGWSGTDDLVLVHPITQDSIRVHSTSGTPVGIQIYRIDEQPNVTCGITGIGNNDRYFGVFVTDITSTYEITYHYGGNPFILPADEPNLALFTRQKNSDTTCVSWSDLVATLDVGGDSLSKNALTHRGEYILGTVVGALLPLKFLKFEANVEGDKVRLNWSTVLEENIDYFALERSKDGIEFEQFGTEIANGGKANTNNYVSHDENPMSGFSYYRVKPIDKDGGFNFSNIDQVYLDGLDIITVYPNPTQGILNFQIGASDQINLSLNVYSVLGQTIYNRELQISKGTTTLEYDASSLATGTYFIRIITPSGLFAKKQFMVK